MDMSSPPDAPETRIREPESKIAGLEQQIDSLTRSRDEFEEIFILSPDLLCIADLNTARFTRVNPTFIARLGYPETELLGRPFFDFVHPDDVEATRNVLEQELREGKKVVNFSNRYKCADGSNLWLDWISHPVPERGLTFAAAHDITSQKQLERELRESQSFIRSVMDNLPLGIAVNLVDPVVEFYYMNDNFPKIYGTTREALADPNKFWEAVYEDSNFRATMQKRVLDDCATGVPERMVWDGVPITRKGKETRYISARNTPVPDKNLMISTVWDVTAAKQGEKDRRKLQEQLATAQKMESIGRLAGGVAHDFNNMLGVILGHAELMQDILAPDHPAAEGIREIMEAAERSANLTQQLLAFARKQPVSPRILELNTVVNGMLDMLRRLIGENITLSWQPAEETWKVKMDPGQIDQIMANLCVNARDSIEGTGLISIATQNISFASGDLFLEQHLSPGNYVLLTITDSGSGMSEDVQEHLFDPFYTTKGPGEGTGLGLSTVYGIVKQNQGYINVYSEPGKGSIFRIYLPQYEGEIPIEPDSTGTVKISSGDSQLTILLVEDELPNLSVCTAMLKKLNYHVLASASPRAALALAKSHDGPIDLLITDVVMPEMNGKDLAGELARVYPNIRNLYMSGYTADIIAHHGVLEDGVNFLQKPFSLSVFSKKIEEALNRGTS